MYSFRFRQQICIVYWFTFGVGRTEQKYEGEDCGSNDDCPLESEHRARARVKVVEELGGEKWRIRYDQGDRGIIEASLTLPLWGDTVRRLRCDMLRGWVSGESNGEGGSGLVLMYVFL